MATGRRQGKLAGRGQGILRVLSVLALLMLSFAHQPVFARQMTPEMATDYTLPDGSIGDICFGLDGVDGKGHGPHEGLAPVCDFCRLSASVLLPPPATNDYLIIRAVSFLSIGPVLPSFIVVYPPASPQSRAPPVLL